MLVPVYLFERQKGGKSRKGREKKEETERRRERKREIPRFFIC